MQSIRKRFETSSLQFIDEGIVTDPERTRAQLARLMCAQLAWRSPNGHYQATARASGLPRGEKRGCLHLSEPGWTLLKKQVSGQRAPFARPPLACSLAEWGDRQLRMVNGDRGGLILWRWLMGSWGVRDLMCKQSPGPFSLIYRALSFEFRDICGELTEHGKAALRRRRRSSPGSVVRRGGAELKDDAPAEEIFSLNDFFASYPPRFYE